MYTLFPDMFCGPFATSIVRRAQDREIVAIRVHNIRDWASDKHHTTDDTPYGGGPGMVMLAAPIVDAIEATLGPAKDQTRIVLLSAGGRKFSQEVAAELVAAQRLALICGRYEGIDERVSIHLGADEISVGDFVLTGGELAAMAVVDATTRLVPGVIDAASIREESHLGNLVEYPHYTRPAEFRGLAVPDILLSGHHANIAVWRREQARLRTARWRPDLLEEHEDPETNN
ncbi:MAG: tRNA (guanosine(37)-N1)-methyltransferase TrmD [Chloroflexota bacterium]|nr:tRNA (guanosine(37)-N1)-methyltransferase TrmD [Chloroflexota bacterium]